jgi:hypothetical protein
MSGRSSSADEEVAGDTYSASGSDNAQASQLPDRQRRWLPIVDTHNLGRVLHQAEIQVGDSPGFFFAAMPTPRTPKSGEKAKQPSAASARKMRAKAAKKAAEEAAARAKSITQQPDQTGVTDPDVPQCTGVHPQGDSDTTPDQEPGPRVVAGSSGTGEGKNLDKDQTSKEDATPSLGSAKSPMKRPSQTKTGASKPKKLVGDDPRKSGGDDPRRDHEIPYDKGKDQEMPSSPSSVDSLSFGSDSEFMSDMYTIVDAEVRENGSLVLESLLHPGVIQDITATLAEEVTNITVFFPTFTRYFLDKGRSFEMMVADHLRHRESNQNGGEPLIL